MNLQIQQGAVVEVRLKIDLRQWAAAHDMSLTELGRRAGLSHTAIRKVADGEQRPGTRTIAGLMAATKLSFRTLFDTTRSAA